MLLLLVIEECNETSQRATKALRFGLEEIQENKSENPKQLNNAERLIYEFNDLVSAMNELYMEGYIDKVFDFDAQVLKQEKIKKYLELSQKLGTYDPK